MARATGERPRDQLPFRSSFSRDKRPVLFFALAGRRSSLGCNKERRPLAMIIVARIAMLIAGIIGIFFFALLSKVTSNFYVGIVSAAVAVLGGGYLLIRGIEYFTKFMQGDD